ncbi:uncharacterized protein LOC110888220 [Helianthus annuus]|uniref:uncharacterized protein LOC110888220 n=1 Tax=Helianthus annuus TaxID=4232 RepID=UPI000B8F3C5A|nr:uncharacterized protein LOC110888220 [Helianthus annuus]
MNDDIGGNKHSIDIQSRTYVGLNGKAMTYCGATLSSINAVTPSCEPDTGGTQMQSVSVEPGTGTSAKVGAGETMKGQTMVQDDPADIRPVLCPPPRHSSSHSTQDNISCTTQHSHLNTAGPSRLRSSRPKKTEGVRIRTPRRAAFASTEMRADYEGDSRNSYHHFNSSNCRFFYWTLA